MTLQKNNKDCLQCCLSDILNIPYEEIPEFYKLYPVLNNVLLESESAGELFRKSYDLWLRGKGLIRILIEVQYNRETNKIHNFPYLSLDKYKCIGILSKKENSYDHAVVIEFDNEDLFISDPKDNSDYDISELIEVEFFFPLNNMSI